MAVEAILLSAGESSRMGKPKALLDWFGEPLILAQTHSLIEGGADRVIVVTGAHHDEISTALTHEPNITIANNPNWSQGKTTSIKTRLEPTQHRLPNHHRLSSRPTSSLMGHQPSTEISPGLQTPSNISPLRRTWRTPSSLRHLPPNRVIQHLRRTRRSTRSYEEARSEHEPRLLRQPYSPL